MRVNRLLSISLLFCGSLYLLSAQWITYPIPGIPRTKDGKPDLNAPVPKTVDGKPDLSGMWSPFRTAEITTADDKAGVPAANGFVKGVAIDFGTPIGGLPYQPWAAELVRTRRNDGFKDAPDGKCLPISPPELTTVGIRQVIQLPGMIAMLFEKDQMFRIIYTDGRPLPIDPQPSWLGYSVGHWDGDVLVVETIGLRDDTWLDVIGNPMTSAGHITERYKRLSYGKLEIELTIDDPKAYRRPWTVKVQHQINPEAQLIEGFCENERDQRHIAK